MKQNDIYYRYLEELNNENIELLNSKEYRLGKKILNIKNHNFIEMLKEYILRKKVEKYNGKNIKVNNNTHKISSDKKIVVYTCITGGYDDVQEPFYSNPNVDYIIYTDLKIKTEKWKYKVIPENIKLINDNIIINRYIKFKMHELFSNYDYAIYIDGNVKIIGDVTKLIEKINNKSGLALHSHNCRNCAYNEAQVCVLKKKGVKNKIQDLIRKMKLEKFPTKYGLFEANVIAVDLKNENAKKIMNDWYNIFKESECYRDQIILPYVLWKNNLKFEDVGNLGENMHLNPILRKIKHK